MSALLCGIIFRATIDFCTMPRARKPKVIKPVAPEIPEELIVKFNLAIGTRVKKLRTDRNHGVEDFAYEIDIARNTLIGVESENGEGCTTETLIRIIYGLGITVGEFFSDESFSSIIKPAKPSRPAS